MKALISHSLSINLKGYRNIDLFETKKLIII
jgi:hypothetical protein